MLTELTELILLLIRVETEIARLSEKLLFISNEYDKLNYNPKGASICRSKIEELENKRSEVMEKLFGKTKTKWRN